MKTEEFEESINNFSDKTYEKGRLKVVKDGDSNINVILVVDDNYPDFCINEPLATISSDKSDSFTINPDNSSKTWIVNDGLYKLIKDYASTPIDERGNVSTKDFKYLSERVTDNYLNLSHRLDCLEDDMNKLKNKKPHWFE